MFERIFRRFNNTKEPEKGIPNYSSWHYVPEFNVGKAFGNSQEIIYPAHYELTDGNKMVEIHKGRIIVWNNLKDKPEENIVYKSINSYTSNEVEMQRIKRMVKELYAK
jgi:hypothetical protein